jgi:hypothetical protein
MGKRKNSTKKERTDLLKRLGYTEEQMKAFWDECISVNSKIKMLAQAGYDWTDLCVWQIEELPTLKEKTLKQLEEKKTEEERKEQEKQDKLLAKKLKYDNLEKFYLDKIDNKVELTESELEELYDNFEYETRTGEMLRWTTEKDTVLKIGDRYFMLTWYKGNTEYQESQFSDQPYEVVEHTYEKTITFTEWLKKE